jgi:hypothetical protein
MAVTASYYLLDYEGKRCGFSQTRPKFRRKIKGQSVLKTKRFLLQWSRATGSSKIMKAQVISLGYVMESKSG